MPIESLLAIVVVVELVWILSSLFRNKEEEKARQQGRVPQRGQTVNGNRPRPAPTNVDRFLEEMNRRRREAVERENAEVRQHAARPTPRSRPASPPVEFVVVPGPAASGRTVSVPMLITTDAPRNVPKPPPRAEEAAFVGSQVTTTFHGSPGSPGSQDASISPRNWILDHLRNRDLLRSAMLLQQVLGPPLSKRS